MTLPKRVMLWVTVAVMASIAVIIAIQMRFVGPEIQRSRMEIVSGFATLVREAPDPVAKASELERAFGYQIRVVANIEKDRIQSKGDDSFTRGSLDDTIAYFPLGTDQLIAVGPLPFGSPPIVRLALLSIFVALGVAGLVAWFLIAPVVRGLQNLEETSKRITQGELDARTTSEHTQGIAEVAHAFNSMADNNQQLIKNQEHLLRAVSHEFRTPAARVRFDLELLNSATTPEARTDRSRRIEDSLDELDELVSELLEYTRFDLVRPDLPKIDILLSEEFDYLESKTPLPAHVTFRFESTSSAILHGSPKHVRRVLSNLVQNALRHASSQIRVSAKRIDSNIEIRVEDDGSGIPSADRERIFEPFVRLDESRDRLAGGFGIGLAIVQQIVHWHDAELIVEDCELGGACFLLRFPAVESASERFEVDTHGARKTVSSSAPNK